MQWDVQINEVSYTAVHSSYNTAVRGAYKPQVLQGCLLLLMWVAGEARLGRSVSRAPRKAAPHDLPCKRMMCFARVTGGYRQASSQQHVTCVQRLLEVLLLVVVYGSFPGIS